MKYVVIVNGKPESGKTTFQRKCINYLDENESAYGYTVSSIAPIKDIYKKLGWNGEKTDKARKELSILKKMWIDNCNGPIKHIVEYVMKLSDTDDHVVFVDIREEEEIENIVEVFNTLRLLDIRCKTVLVKRPDNDGIEYGNKSDDMVGNKMSLYDHIINNDGNINDLQKLAEKFINILFTK